MRVQDWQSRDGCESKNMKSFECMRKHRELDSDYEQQRFWRKNIPRAISSEWLPEGDLVYFVMDVVKQLDLRDIYCAYESPKGGQPCYPRGQ